MNKKYSDELLNMKFSFDVLDGIKEERTFFSITEESLRDTFHVLPTDSLEEARKKIMDKVSTDDFLYEYFHKDPRFWEVKSFTPGYWTTPTKIEKVLTKDEIKELGYSDDEIKKMRLPVKESRAEKIFEQKLTINFVKRDLSNVISDEKFFEIYDKEFKEFLAHDNMFTTLLKNKFAIKPKKKTKERYNGDKLIVIPDVELHLGKLASKFDSADSYDYKKALYRYVTLILKAESVQKMYKAKEICMTIGNDYFNTDTEQNTTTAGTEQHNDTRFQQMITSGIVAHVWAIERMKENCDKLILKFNPGNHDYLIDYTLYMQLCYLYKNDPKVEIECKVKDVRWATGLKWHNNLIIFAHGKTPEGKALNDDKLALLKDTDMFREDAKSVDNVTVLAGHLHNASENNFSKRKNTPNGTTVIRSGSPSGDGAWDSGNLYSADKTHQVYVFDSETGYYSTVNLRLTKEELEKGISMGAITDNTDYLKTVEKSISRLSNDITSDMFKKYYYENEKAIRQINKKYETKLEKLTADYGLKNITEEQKERILITLGYNDEIKPYLELRESLHKELHSNEKKLAFKKA